LECFSPQMKVEGWEPLEMAEMTLAAGFMLRMKADGWKLFCERMGVPPFAVWECLPGYSRLKHALTRAKEAASLPESLLRWLNKVRPKRTPKLTEVPWTVERVADAHATFCRERAEWWGGDPPPD